MTKLSDLKKKENDLQRRLSKIRTRIAILQDGIETCCVVDQFCEAPANLENPIPARFICYSCGQAVCGKCSSIRVYYGHGKQRLCNNCQIDYDGNDKRVMARIYKLAGY